MRPARHRLESTDPVVLEGKKRLVFKRDLTGADGVAQVALQRTPAADDRLVLQFEEAESAAAFVLGPVQRGVRLAKEFVGVLAVGWRERNADARRMHEPLALHDEGHREGFQNAFRYLRSRFWRVGAQCDDGEFVAANAATVSTSRTQAVRRSATGAAIGPPRNARGRR